MFSRFHLTCLRPLVARKTRWFPCCGAARWNTSVSREKPGERWRPIVLKYLRDTHAAEYPDYTALLSTVCHEFDSLSLTLLAELIADAASKHVDCRTAVDMLAARLVAERETHHAEELVAISELCGELAGQHGSNSLSTVAFELLTSRPSSLPPRCICEIAWNLRRYIAADKQWRKKLPCENFLLSDVAEKAPPVPAFRLLTVCVDGLSEKSVSWASLVMRRVWTSRGTDDHAFDTLLTFLQLARALPSTQANGFAPTVMFCLEGVNADHVEMGAAVSIVFTLLHLLPEPSELLVESFVRRCLGMLADVDATSLPALLGGLFQKQSGRFRPKTVEAVLKTVSSGHHASVSDKWLCALCLALLLHNLQEVAILEKVAGRMCSVVATWNADNLIWQTLANLLFHSRLVHSQLTVHVIERLSTFDKVQQTRVGGIMYWLWSATVSRIKVPAHLLWVLHENPRAPGLQKDFTVFLYSELQWLHNIPRLPFHYPLHKDFMCLSHSLSKRLVSAFGGRVSPVSVQLLASRPVFCAAILLNEKRRLLDWRTCGLSPGQVDRQWLAEQKVHALAVVVQPSPSSTPTTYSLCSVDQHVWHRTVEAQGWEVSVLHQQAIEDRSSLELRQLVSQQANIR